MMFRERALELQIRTQEFQAYLNKDLGGEVAVEHIKQIRTLLNTYADVAREMANEEDMDAATREQLCALWLIYSTNKPSSDGLEALLPSFSDRSALGTVVSALGANRPVSTRQLTPLAELNISPWLRSRLRSYVLKSEVPSNTDGPHAKSEKEHFGGLAPLVLLFMLLGFSGTSILFCLLAAPFLLRWQNSQLPPQNVIASVAVLLAGLVYLVMGGSGFFLIIGLLGSTHFFWSMFKNSSVLHEGPDVRTTPFASEPWVGTYVVMGWFAFFTTLQITVSGFGAPHPIIIFATKVADGVFSLWLIGQLGLAQGRLPIKDVIALFKLDLSAFNNRIMPAISWTLGGYACAIPLYLLAATAQTLIVDPDLVTNPVMPELVKSGNPLGKTFLIASVLLVAPFFEECLFRGFFYNQLRNKLSVRRASIISAAVFAAAHMNIQIFLPLFALGWILAQVTERSKSLLPAMLIHAVFNGANVLMAVAVYGS